MTLQDGVGRSGYRMLSLVFLGIGLLGLASSLYAFLNPSSSYFNALGFCLSAVGLGALFVLLLVLLSPGLHAPAPTASEAAALPGSPSLFGAGLRPIHYEAAGQGSRDYGHPAGDEGDLALPGPPEESAGSGGLRPEAGPGGRDMRDGSGRGTVVTRAGPRMPAPTFERAARVVGLDDAPAASALERLPPPEQWTPPPQPRAPVIAPPRKRAASGLTLGQKRELERQGIALPRRQTFEPEEGEVAIPLAMHPARTPPPREPVPTVLARPATGAQDPDWVPEGETRGQCGKCKTVILAPKRRPVNVRCPRCDKITLLQ